MTNIYHENQLSGIQKKKYHSGILNWFLETFIMKIYLHIVSFKWHEQKVTSDIKTHGTLILSRWKLQY